MNKYLIATGVLVLVTAMCIPASVFSDGSDAFEITTGEAGISWESDELEEKQISALYDIDEKTNLAYTAMRSIIWNAYHYEISEINISKAKISMANGIKVTENEKISTADDSGTYELTFKATCAAGHGGEQLFDNSTDMLDLIKYVTFDNESQEGAIFVFNVKLSVINMEHSIVEFEKNAADDCVVIKQTITGREFISVKGDVKYTFTDGTEQVTKAFSVDFVYNAQVEDRVNEQEFNKEIQDVVAGDKAISNYSTGACSYQLKQKYTFDEESGGLDDEWSDDDYPEPLGPVMILGADDLKIPTYEFLYSGGDSIALFYSVGSPELDTNEKVKSFLEDNGSLGETFDTAEDLCESELDQPPAKTRIWLLVSVFVVMVSIAAVTVIVLSRRNA